MRYLLALSSGLILLSLSCRLQPQQTLIPSSRDSLIKPYLEALATGEKYDTTETGNRVLRAYLCNDTAYLRKLSGNIVWKKQVDKANSIIDSCVHLPVLADMHVDEAYRFVYQFSFNPDKFNITVWRRKDSSYLHFIKYYSWYDASFVCKIEKEYTKPLTKQQWDELIHTLQSADFWGLKFDNDIHGLDGSILIASGYIAPYSTPYVHHPARYTNVYRWCGNSLPIGSAYSLVEKFSAEKEH